MSSSVPCSSNFTRGYTVALVSAVILSDHGYLYQALDSDLSYASADIGLLAGCLCGSHVVACVRAAASAPAASDAPAPVLSRRLRLHAGDL